MFLSLKCSVQNSTKKDVGVYLLYFLFRYVTVQLLFTVLGPSSKAVPVLPYGEPLGSALTSCGLRSCSGAQVYPAKLLLCPALCSPRSLWPWWDCLAVWAQCGFCSAMVLPFKLQLLPSSTWGAMVQYPLGCSLLNCYVNISSFFALLPLVKTSTPKPRETLQL